VIIQCDAETAGTLSDRLTFKDRLSRSRDRCVNVRERVFGGESPRFRGAMAGW